MANVITICGSLRKGSYNRMLMNLLPSLAPSGMNITPAPSFADMPVYNTDVQDKGIPASVTALADAVRAADGVIFVTPEYNFSVPGGLKNAIDWVSRVKDQPFVGKPVAIQTCSGGPVGGARVQYHLRQCLLSVEGLTMPKPEVFVGNCASKFNDKGELTDETTRNFVKQQLEAFAKFIARIGTK